MTQNTVQGVCLDMVNISVSKNILQKKKDSNVN